MSGVEGMPAAYYSRIGNGGGTGAGETGLGRAASFHPPPPRRCHDINEHAFVRKGETKTSLGIRPI